MYTVYSSELPGVTLLTSGMRVDQYLVYVYVAISIIELNLHQPNCFGTSLCVRFIQVKSTKMSNIGTSLTVGFIHVSYLVSVDSLLSIHVVHKSTWPSSVIAIMTRIIKVKYFKIPKRLPEAVNWRRTCNTMAKRKRTKRQEKFEDTKGVIKSHQLTKDIEYNSQKKIRTKRQTHIYQTLQRELKIEQQGRHKNKVVYHFIDYFCVIQSQMCMLVSSRQSHCNNDFYS